jgi:thioredoxin-related protein
MHQSTLAKTFALRGVPTSILINKEGKNLQELLVQ